MKTILCLIAALMILLGLTGLLWPESLMPILRYSLTTGIYVAAIVRIILGALLMWGAPASRTPKALRVIGGIILVAGVATAFLTGERAQLLVTWWQGHGSGALRIAACFPLAVGFFIAGATLTKGSNSQPVYERHE